jgi:hypothetical protein
MKLSLRDRWRETRPGASGLQRASRDLWRQDPITDDTRIRESLPTISYPRKHGAKTILMSHQPP